MRKFLAGAVCVAAAALAIGAATAGAGNPNTLTLAVFGDSPYLDPAFPAHSELNATPAFIATINNDPSIQETIHVGDIHSGSEPCTAAYDHSIVIAQQDVRGLTPDDIERLLPAVRNMQPGVFCFNPPYGVRIGGEHGEEELLALYADMGRALGRFSGWRAACFVANPKFVYAFGHRATMTKPASNANLRGTFLVFQL